MLLGQHKWDRKGGLTQPMKLNRFLFVVSPFTVCKVLACFDPSPLLLGPRAAPLAGSRAVVQKPNPAGTSLPLLTNGNGCQAQDEEGAGDPTDPCAPGAGIFSGKPGHPSPGRGSQHTRPSSSSKTGAAFRPSAPPPSTAMFWSPWDSVRIMLPWPRCHCRSIQPL